MAHNHGKGRGGNRRRKLVVVKGDAFLRLGRAKVREGKGVLRVHSTECTSFFTARHAVRSHSSTWAGGWLRCDERNDSNASSLLWPNELAAVAPVVRTCQRSHTWLACLAANTSSLSPGACREGRGEQVCGGS